MTASRQRPTSPCLRRRPANSCAAERKPFIAHDWGAVAAWGAAGKEADRWRRCVVLNIPPLPIFGENIVKYDQIKRSFYFWYFQMEQVAEDVISADDFAFIDRIWADWSPGYDASEDLPKVKECIRDPAHFRAALGYYWGLFDPKRFGSEEWAAEQAATWGNDITQPTLYLHGTQDGCHGCDQDAGPILSPSDQAEHRDPIRPAIPRDVEDLRAVAAQPRQNQHVIGHAFKVSPHARATGLLRPGCGRSRDGNRGVARWHRPGARAALRTGTAAITVTASQSRP